MITNSKYAFFSLWLLLFALPFEMIFSTIASIVFLITVLMSSSKEDFRRLLSFRWPYILLLYFTIVCIGVLYTDNPYDAIDRVIRQLPLIIYPTAIVLLSPNKNQIQMAKKVFIMACFVFSLISLGLLVSNFIINFDSRHHYNFVQRSMYHFHFPYDTLYVNIAFIFLLWGDFGKRVKQLVSLIYFVVVFLFGVRIGIGSFLLIGVIYLILNIKNILNRESIAIIVVLFGLCAILVNISPYAKDKYYDTLNKIGLATNENVSKIGAEYHQISLRKELWKGSWDLIKKRPIFGFGTSGAHAALKQEYIKRGLEKHKNLNSHNQYLSTTLQYGIIGLVLLLGILGVLFYRTFKSKEIDGFIFSLCILIAFMTEVYLTRQKGIMVFALFVTLFLNPFRSEEKILENEKHSSSEQ